MCFFFRFKEIIEFIVWDSIIGLLVLFKMFIIFYKIIKNMMKLLKYDDYNKYKS